MEVLDEKGKPLIVIDLDNTSAGLDQGYEKRMLEIIPPEILSKRITSEYWVDKQFPHAVEYHDQLLKIFEEEGFFLNLEPLNGAIEAINEMSSEGLAIRFCTTPHLSSEYCHNEKNAWVEKYFGKEYVLRTIFTFDKTVILGDVLIDDKPEINGLRKDNPLWTHVLFDHPHNQHVNALHRLTNWADWRQVVYPILKSQGF